jgi:3-methyladenine DNA glycosylase AlkD
LDSEYNEIRFFGQQVLVNHYKKAKNTDQRYEILQFLYEHIQSVNHWNLVDSISDVYGKFALETQDFSFFDIFRSSDSIWQKRIAIVACLPLVKRHVFEPALSIIEKHLTYPHEYIHKANGWVLREIGKADEKKLITFLKTHWKQIPPVTKSYATEKLRATYDIKALF